MAVITSYQSEVPSLAKSVVTCHDYIIGTHCLAARLILFQKIIRLVNTSHLMIQSFQIKHVRRRNYISIFCGLYGFGGYIRDFLALFLLSTRS